MKICIRTCQHFIYLGHDISHNYGNDVKNKVTKFGEILRMIKNTIRKNTSRVTYDFMTTPVVVVVVCVSKTQTVPKLNQKKIQPSEIISLRNSVRCLLLGRRRVWIKSCLFSL